MKYIRFPAWTVVFILILTFYGSACPEYTKAAIPVAAKVPVPAEKDKEDSEILLSVTSLTDPVRAENGAARSAAALNLPEEIRVRTTGRTRKALVLWNLQDCDYDPDEIGEQEFTVTGQVLLPDYIENPEKLSCEITADVVVEARAPVMADEDENRIVGLTDGARFTTQNRISFEAIGDQMDLKDPQAGDTRYIPSGWMVLENRFFEPVEPYEASFRIAKAGGFTLTVTFSLQEYDGKNWNNTGYQDEKYVSFTIVSDPEAEENSEDHRSSEPSRSLPVDTGDHTPFFISLFFLFISGCGTMVILFKFLS